MAEATPAIIQDGVHCIPPSGINVLIVGAGVGGLTAALECHRKGHSVRIIERAPNATAAGMLINFSRLEDPKSNLRLQGINSQSASLAAAGFPAIRT